MSAEAVELPRPTLAEQMPTYAQLLSKLDRYMRLAEDLRQDKERALYELHLMRGNGILDLNKLERAIKGDQR